MKKVILFLMFLPVPAFGQIIDDFESGSTGYWIQGTEGHWKADTLQAISGDFSLHHIFDNSLSGSDCIGLPLTNLHPSEDMTRWSFSVRYGCDPSSSNSWAVYLMSDTDPGSFANGSGVSGYAVGVNLSGYDDTLRLWKIRNGSAATLITCPVNWQTGIGIGMAARIIVERSVSGTWSVSVYDSGGMQKGTASGADIELFSHAWLVVNYRYTSTRDRLLWFDDLKIEGVFYEDKTPPEITNCIVSGVSSLDLTFNEEPSDEIMLPSNYSLNGGSNTPLKVEKKSPVLYHIFFEDEFINKKTNTLVINHLCDRSGNCADAVKKTFTPAWVEAGDVIISEIMADPLPAVSAPPVEYIEISNRTGYSFDLKNCYLSADDQKTVFPAVKLDPGEYMIICSQNDSALFSGYGKTAGLKSFPALTDGGRLLAISDSLGNLIHGVDYSSDWYGNALKAGGGWSLEMIDPEYPFYARDNWEASSSKNGGTPGKINSVSRINPDLSFKGMMNVFPTDNTTISIRFSEPLVYFIRESGKIIIEWIGIKSVSSSDLLLRDFIIKTDDPLVAGKMYSISMSDEITDFAGNPMGRNFYRFGIPETAGNGDIVFNELLFNPYPDDPDYIEFYNCSGKVIDASQLYLASVSTETGDTSEIKPVSGEGRCILPGSFYAVTTDCRKISDRYTSSDEEALFTASSLPSMPDDKGHLLLLNRNMELIDEVIYSEKMHYPLLAGCEGVSLEKIRPDLKSDESTSWYSASESSGWGTPGRENSAFSREASADDRIKFSSGRISPDNDGYEDVLVIDLNLAGTGNVVSATIFDETGSFVRKICENLFAGSKASLVWDGTSADNSLVNSGIYIILIEMYNDKGKTRSWKKVCTIIR